MRRGLGLRGRCLGIGGGGVGGVAVVVAEGGRWECLVVGWEG